jgi:hypothetical protein
MQEFSTQSYFQNSEEKILEFSIKSRSKLNSGIHDQFPLQEYKNYA